MAGKQKSHQNEAQPTPANTESTTSKVYELRDGTKVLIRPIQVDDKDKLQDGFQHLSKESRYLRFLSPINQLSSYQLRYSQ